MELNGTKNGEPGQNRNRDPLGFEIHQDSMNLGGSDRIDEPKWTWMDPTGWTPGGLELKSIHSNNSKVDPYRCRCVCFV